eukprot:1324160-Rhodomonas_salina.2
MPSTARRYRLALLSSPDIRFFTTRLELFGHTPYALTCCPVHGGARFVGHRHRHGAERDVHGNDGGRRFRRDVPAMGDTPRSDLSDDPMHGHPTHSPMI